MKYRRSEPYRNVPKAQWAETIIKKYYPQCPEKATLVALASYAEPDGSSIFVKYDTLARDTGRSLRSVKRHVKELAFRQDIQVTCPLVGGPNCNHYRITLEGSEERVREAIARVSKNQLRLPLVGTYLAETLGLATAEECHSASAKVALDQVPKVHTTNILSKILPEKEKSFKNSSVDQDYSVEGPISEKTRKMIAETLENLRMGADLDAIQEGYTIAPLIFGGDGEG